MGKLRYILFSLMALCFTLGYAQKTLTGVVNEDFDGMAEPIYGANVVVINSQNRTLTGAITDLDGNYMLSIPANEKNIRIQVSFIGMKTETVNYTGQTTLNFKLMSDSKMLSDVEVVTKKVERDQMGVSFKEQTSATQKINMAEITETAPVSSVEEALQGQLAGVDITMGGDPGQKSSIRIRGVNSMSSSSEPLIVIDDIPSSISSDDFDFSTASDDDWGDLLNISPSDIESIEVLKDASATAIYGTSGSNGVLLIKTKSGAKGKTKFTFSSKFSVKQEPASLPLLNGKQYVALMQDAIWNAANARGLSNASDYLELLYNTPEIGYNKSWQYFDEYNVDTDWLDAVRQDAYSSDNNFSISGGGDKATYLLSVGFLDDVGTTIGTELKRLTSKLKITYKFSDAFEVYTDFSFTNTDKDANVSYSSMPNARSMAQRKMPNLSPYYINEDGTQSSSYFTRQEDFQGKFDGSGSSNYNPLALVNDGYNNTGMQEEKMTINVKYKFPFDITYQGYVSMNMKTTKNRQFLPQSATGVLWTSTLANRSTDAVSDNFSLKTENKLMYNHVIAKKHSVLATALLRTSSSNSSSATNVTYGNVSLNLSDPVVGSTVASASSGESESRKVEMIAQAIYTYDSRYVLRATVNREGNSAMGKSHRFGTFPAFGFAWNVYNEKFAENWEWLTEGKLRAGLGWSGNAPSSGTYYLGAYSTLGSYMDMSAIYPSRMQLDKLKWESTKEWDLGLDVRLFDRLGMTFDYYYKYTKDCLLSGVDVPSSTGYSSIKYMNSGELSNCGYELRFDYTIFKNKDWDVAANVNMARNMNKVESIPANYTFENYSFGNGNYAIRVVEGDPIGSFYGYRYKGVYQNSEDTYARDAKGNVMYDFKGKVITMKNGTTQCYAGDAKYEDINNDGVINESDIVYLGNYNPTVTGGAGVTVKYKQWKLSTTFHGRFGQKVINAARMNLENMYGTNNQSTAVLSRWRSEGDDTDIPRALYGMGYNYLGSDRFVEDATYVRLKQVSLSYNLPKAWLKNWGVNALSVFVTGYDLFTWTDYSGQDPEISLPSKATSLLKDSSTTPVTKRFTFGFNLNF